MDYYFSCMLLNLNISLPSQMLMGYKGIYVRVLLSTELQKISSINIM